jgi:hypothetical protein
MLLVWFCPADILHIAVKLLFAVGCTVHFTHQRALAHETDVWLANKMRTLAQKADKAGTLNLLLEALLQAVIGFFAVLDCVNSHRVRRL